MTELSTPAVDETMFEDAHRHVYYQVDLDNSEEWLIRDDSYRLSVYPLVTLIDVPREWTVLVEYKYSEAEQCNSLIRALLAPLKRVDPATFRKDAADVDR